MTAPGAKVGPLTQADLQAIWTGAVDTGFSQPFVAAGEGAGFEAYTQMFAQYARVALAVDVTTQAMFILPYSGQSNPPASGANEATVVLTISRTGYVNWALVLVAGTLVGEVQNDWGTNGSTPVATGRLYALTQALVFPPGDSGPYGVQAQAVTPGYGYNNPQGAWTDANGNVHPGVISQVEQPGTQYTRDQATVTVTPAGAPVASVEPPANPGVSAQALLVSLNQPSMFLPQHVGQYVLMTSGANVGKIGRMTSFIAPAPPSGSAVVLDYEQAVELTGVLGSFVPNEVVAFTTGGSVVATGAVLGSQPIGAHVRLVYTLQTGTPAVGSTVAGTNSGALGTVQTLLQNLTWTPEAPNPSAPSGSGAVWRVLDWVADWGLSVGNATQPTGGTSAMLDMLVADERLVLRAKGEPDATYRLRGAQVSDVTSPNAVKRALARSLGAMPWCFREVGSAMLGLAGFFYDRLGDPLGDFYDTNVLLLAVVSLVGTFFPNERVWWVDASGYLVAQGLYGGTLPGSILLFVMRSRGPRRLTVLAGDQVVGQSSGASWNVTGASLPSAPEVTMRYQEYLDYLDMRAFFVVALAPNGLGEMGFFYDQKPLAHVGGFYDQNVQATNFYDGFPFLFRQAAVAAWQAVERVRPGGVTWTMLLDGGPCP